MIEGEPGTLYSEPRRRPLGERPGLRTFRRAGFRSLVAATLLVIAVGLLAALLARQAADPAGQYGIDFAYWHKAAGDVAAGRSPYPARYLDGPVVATDFGYKYPPTFAQALLPLAGLPLSAAAGIWVVLQVGVSFAAVWLAGSYGGARPSVERLLWSGVATALFLPMWDSVWKGNVSAVQAFQLALVLGGGAVAGASLASAILLKTTPLALAPAAVLRGGRILRATLATGLAVFVLSALAAPQAWLDFIRIQPNLLTGPATSPTNLAPASMVAGAAPDLPAVAGVVRALTLLVGVMAVVWSLLLARRSGGWPAAVLLGTVAILVVPGVIWYHYLAMLLPFAAFAWPRASVQQRWWLISAAAAITIGLAWLPLAALGAAALIVVSLRVLIPPASRSSAFSSNHELVESE
ncbi:hypothetical protein BH24CHL7_BH24CHL7_03000 [soil metagenome]